MSVKTDNYSELIEKKKKQDEFLRLRDIDDNSRDYPDIVKRYNEINARYKEGIREEHTFLSNKQELEKNIQKLTLDIRNITTLNYSNTNSFRYIDNKISELENLKLRKHLGLSKRKIEKSILTLEERRKKISFDNNKTKKEKKELELELLKLLLKETEQQLDSIYLDRKEMYKELDEIKKEIKEKYNCDSIDEVKDVLTKAREYILNNSDFKIDYDLERKLFEKEQEEKTL